MIAQKVLENAASVREAFQTAQPFKHICIDGFFESPDAERLLADFPSFDAARAINEFGDVGGKATNPNLRDISPFYGTVYDYLMSPRFLSEMTEITGIEGLIPDPTMFGGGTHENLHGQGLDPHIDFNQLSADGATVHRRANLLLYLNKVWEDSWGGAIELHSNPREPEINQVKAFTPLFNRAVIFETNEVSWHGFPTIALPEERCRTDSRKCLSVYLYTRDRPAHEIAGSHGTFYVQRPLPPRFVAGYQLTPEDIKELRQAVRGRDRFIESYQRAEEATGRQLSELSAYLADVVSRHRLPVTGFARQVGRAAGASYPDDWCGETVSVELQATEALSLVTVKGLIGESAPRKTRRLHIKVGDRMSDHTVDHNDMFALETQVELAEGTRFAVEITCDSTFNPAGLGLNADTRDLGFLLTEIACVCQTAGLPGEISQPPDEAKEPRRSTALGRLFKAR